MGKKRKTITQISAKDFAQAKGVSLKSIYNAVDSGRLTPINPQGRPLLFDREKAVQDWEAFRKEEHVPKSKRENSEGENEIPEGFNEADEVNRHNAGVHRKIATAKLEKYRAENERLKFLEQLGKLVDVEAVQKEAFQIARITRDAMLTIPDRISAQLCGITDPVAMHNTITKEINGALDQLTRQYNGQQPEPTTASDTLGTQLPESISGRTEAGPTSNG